jgi:hypothetical protein
VGAQLYKVQVDEAKNSAFIGSVFMRTHGRIVELDARPSDAAGRRVAHRGLHARDEDRKCDCGGDVRPRRASFRRMDVG